MSLTRCVPASVPSLVQSSRPRSLLRSTVKNRRPFNTTKSLTERDVVPGEMSLTRYVPASVPSLRHKSPRTSKNKSPSAPTISSVRCNESVPPGTISRTIWVPGSVPSVVQSSRPYSDELSAEKKSRSPDATKLNVDRTLATRRVPADVPSVVKMACSLPSLPSKYKTSLRTVSSSGR